MHRRNIQSEKFLTKYSFLEFKSIKKIREIVIRWKNKKNKTKSLQVEVAVAEISKGISVVRHTVDTLKLRQNYH